MDKSRLNVCVYVCGGKGNALVHTVRVYGGVKV